CHLESFGRLSALRERRHRSLARRLVAVRGALDVPAVAARPHPGAALRRSRLQMEDATHDLAVFEHVVVVVAPTRWVAALEDERLGRHSYLELCDPRRPRPHTKS